MNILFIGGGNMAAAIIGGLTAGGWPAASITAVDVLADARANLERRFGIRTAADTAAAASAGCVVLAVKPQQMREVAMTIAPVIDSPLVVSIAAGIRCADIARWLGSGPRIVRAMPNTPALVAAGISGLYAMPSVSAVQRDTAERILSAVGATFWVDEERDLDAVTAVSGSGPAYVFYFIEALEQAALELGLKPEIARQSAMATFAGAVKLAAAGDATPAALRERVTSKGGTTERAIGLLDQTGVRDAFKRAVHGAAARAAELGDTLGKDQA